MLFLQLLALEVAALPQPSPCCVPSCVQGDPAPGCPAGRFQLKPERKALHFSAGPYSRPTGGHGCLSPWESGETLTADRSWSHLMRLCGAPGWGLRSAAAALHPTNKAAPGPHTGLFRGRSASPSASPSPPTHGCLQAGVRGCTGFCSQERPRGKVMSTP